jgi:hypothetical protein
VEPKNQRLFDLRAAFTPSGPVTALSAFSGRGSQLLKATGGIAQPGRHVIVYGERGVGKTSLSNVLVDAVGRIGGANVRRSVRVNCTVGATFGSLWSEAVLGLGVEVPEGWAHVAPTPEMIRRALERVEPPSVVIFDEYDRLDDDDALSLMADTVKTLSDNLVRSKVVIVGVGDTIDELVGEHESVRRALEQVLVPRMTPVEVADVVTSRLQIVSMQITDSALARVVRLAEGLPSYAHALPLEAATCAVMDDRLTVELHDIEVATAEIVANHTSRSSYFRATRSPRPDNNYAAVLAACALAPKDELGYFSPVDVRQPLSAILGRPVDIPAFARHLGGFLGEDRGAVLARIGEPRRYKYRFRDPMLQPFALMAAINAGLIETRLIAE